MVHHAPQSTPPTSQFLEFNRSGPCGVAETHNNHDTACVKVEGLEGPGPRVKATTAPATVATAHSSHHPETMAEVLPAHLPDGQSYFSPAPLRRSSPSLLVGSPTYNSPPPTRQPKFPSLDQRTDRIIVASPPSIASPVNLNECDRSVKSFRPNDGVRAVPEVQSDPKVHDNADDNNDDDDDEAIAFPSYDIDGRQDDDNSSKADTYPTPPSGSDSIISTNTSSTPEPLPVSEDDSAIKAEPTRHVDYLSHDWREEDIWSSWRHITTNRKTYGQRSRLENASWRTWAKAKYRLRTVSPETLNW